MCHHEQKSVEKHVPRNSSVHFRTAGLRRSYVAEETNRVHAAFQGRPHTPR